MYDNDKLDTVIIIMFVYVTINLFRDVNFCLFNILIMYTYENYLKFVISVRLGI